MKLSPDIIHSNYQRNNFSLSKTIELLSILIENSYELDIRLESLDLLIKLASNNPETYKVLESCLISDENELIRAKAVIYLFNLHREFQKRIENLSSLLEININEFDLVLNCVNKLKDILIIRKNQGNCLFLKNNAIIFTKDFSIHALSLNLFNRVPKSVFKLKKLEHLDLSYNFLKKLPYQILNLRELKTLNLAGNEINSFPLVLRVCNFKNLLELNLSNNNIKKIPSWIGELSYLKKLDLSNNYIKSFPHSIFRLKSLESLNISKNRIDNIPDELNEIKSLRKITI